MGSCRFEFSRELGVEVRHQQASVLACVVLMGTKEGLVSLRSSSVNLLKVLRHRVIRCDRFLMEILHSIEGGDVEQECANLETNLPCLRLLSLSISHLCLYLACLYYLSLYMLDISCALLLYAWVCLLILVFNQESHSDTSTFNLEEF